MRDLRLIEGGRFEKGDPVLVDGRPGTVICASFETLVFRGEVSVLLDAGGLELVGEERPEYPKRKEDHEPDSAN